MTDGPLGALPIAEFLADYWQKKPCLIRAALPGFEPPLDGDDLAGLACEELAESRIVTGNREANNWNVRHGPFVEQDFAALGDRDWTLLVQDVEKHYPPLQELVARFDFFPTWLLDDLMVSFAAPGGSVGPHIDQYDVFLLQAAGWRRWQVSQDDAPELLHDCPLKVLAEFTPDQEWVLEAGDMLYLPPGVAHHGVALDACLTYSIGLRSPSVAEIVMGLGEELSARADEGGRYIHGDHPSPARPGEIDAAARKSLRGLLQRQLEDPVALQEFLGRFISGYRLATEPAPPPQPPTPEATRQHLSQGGRMQRNPWTRLAWTERDGRARLHANGTPFDCSIELAQTLCRAGAFPLDPDVLDTDSSRTVDGLLRDGHLVLVD